MAIGAHAHRSPRPTKAELEDEVAGVRSVLNQYAGTADLTNEEEYWKTPYDAVTAHLKTVRAALPRGRVAWRLCAWDSRIAGQNNPLLAHQPEHPSLQSRRVRQSRGQKRPRSAPCAEPGGCQRHGAFVPRFYDVGEKGGARPWGFCPGVCARCNTSLAPAYTAPPPRSKQRPSVDEMDLPKDLLAIVRDDSLDLRVWSCLERIVNHVATVRPALNNVAHSVMNLHTQGAGDSRHPASSLHAHAKQKHPHWEKTIVRPYKQPAPQAGGVNTLGAYLKQLLTYKVDTDVGLGRAGAWKLEFRRHHPSFPAVTVRWDQGPLQSKIKGVRGWVTKCHPHS